MKKISIVGMVFSVALAVGYTAKAPPAFAEKPENSPEQLKFCTDCSSLGGCRTTTFGYYGCWYDNHGCDTSGGECLVGF